MHFSSGNSASAQRTWDPQEGFPCVLKSHQEVMEASSHLTSGRVKRSTNDCKEMQAAFSGTSLSLLSIQCLEKGGV